MGPKIICILILLLPSVIMHETNVCETSWDYILKSFSKNCWYNPDVECDLPKLVTQHNYHLKDYYVTTSDGYILRMFRLPNDPNTKGVVFLLHPATASSACWVDKGNDSLAYILYHRGYDVWMPNVRGTTYSRNHTILNPDKDLKYWDFSYHEMGIYDIPALIDFVKAETNVEKLAFVGHSMSGTSAVIYASLLRDHAVKNVNIFVLMSPAVYLGHIKSPMRFLAPFEKVIYKFFEFLGLLEIANRSQFIVFFTKLCYTTVLIKFCTRIMEMTMGPQPEFSYPLLPVMLSQNFAGLSLKCVTHYAQAINNPGTFRWYDYGDYENIKKYRSSIPPDYPLEDIRSSFYIFHGTNDINVTPIDTKLLYNLLLKKSKTRQYGIVSVKNFNHVSFQYSKYLAKKVNIPIADFFDNVIYNH